MRSVPNSLTGKIVLSSHQPNFLPYLGLFYKAFKSDVFVFSDDVLYTKKGMHNYNYIYSNRGPKRITVPIHSHHDRPLTDIKVVEPEYSIPKLLKTIAQEYKKAPMFSECDDFIKLIDSFSHIQDLKLSEFNSELTRFLFDRLDIKPLVLYGASDLKLSGHKDERLFQMCKKTGANVYYSGNGARAYHNEAEYKKRKIELVYTDYQSVQYPQLHKPYEDNLSVIDYIFNVGYNLPERWCK